MINECRQGVLSRSERFTSVEIEGKKKGRIVGVVNSTPMTKGFKHIGRPCGGKDGRVLREGELRVCQAGRVIDSWYYRLNYD